MNKLSIIFFSLIAAASCGDNLKVTEDGGNHGSDGGGSGGFPAAPSIGAQIDRLGRPAINTVLNHGFDATAAAGPAKDAYNQDGSPGGWAQYAAQFAGSLAILDGIDSGLSCNNGACTQNAAAPAGAGCGTQVFYNQSLSGDPNGTPTSMSYAALATILTDDELWLDTTKTTCDTPTHQNYLGVELNALTSGAIPNTCGGRDPLNDVIDTSYSALSVGFSAFNTTTFAVAVGDGVGPHADVHDDVFPFLGTPH